MVIVLKEKIPGILYLAKLSFRCEGEIKTFLEKQKLWGFITIRSIRSALQTMLKGVLQAELKGC